MIHQGDVYWLDLGPSTSSAPSLRHPHVVVQNDVFNASRLATTVVCTITSKLVRTKAPGNVHLEVGEANLPKPCVVNVTQLFTVDKIELTECIGHLSAAKLYEVLAGLDLLLEPRRPE